MSQTNEQVMQERIDELEEAMMRIIQWGDAYPLDVFAEPDWKAARERLNGSSETLDRVAAGAMRRVAMGIAKIARKAMNIADGQ